jgi:hypothetical protein
MFIKKSAGARLVIISVPGAVFGFTAFCVTAFEPKRPFLGQGKMRE